MKKLFIALALAGASSAVMAQEENTSVEPVQKFSVATNSFWSNWFVQGGINWNVWYGGQEDQMGLSKSPFKKFRTNPGLSVAVGKWFTPGIGLRTKLAGIWGKTVTDDNNDGNGNKYWILQEQVLFNLSNLFCGYNPDRVYNLVPFIGGGIERSCTYNRYALGLSAGILNQFYINRKTAINFELGWNLYEADMDGLSKGGERGWASHDHNLYAEVGVTFNIGKGRWDDVPDVDAIKSLSQSQLDALNAQLSDANEENSRLKGKLAQSKEQSSAAAKEVVTTPVSVFFELDKAVVASKKDLVNVYELAKYAKDNNASLLVTGYADSQTGNAEHNKKLSESRAEALVDVLVKLGVSRDKISTEAKGGVNDLSPVSFNRRATVEVKD